jgi:hypothetical protein
MLTNVEIGPLQREAAVWKYLWLVVGSHGDVGVTACPSLQTLHTSDSRRYRELAETRRISGRVRPASQSKPLSSFSLTTASFLLLQWGNDYGGRILHRTFGFVG